MPEPVRVVMPPTQPGLAERLVRLHGEIGEDPLLAGVARVAVALYDETTDLLKTFMHSSRGASPLEHVASRLSDMPTLKQLATTGARRVINDLDVPAAEGQEHAARLAEAGYRSSYTVPILHKGNFYGFVFFNSHDKGFFAPPVVQALRPYAELTALAVMRELDTVRMMAAAVKVIRQVSIARDEETGAHLARMARYARLIATRLAPQHGLSDEFVEFLFRFCPLHDVGKVAVPDAILLKPGRLTPEEFEEMKTHVERGVEIAEGMMRDFRISTQHFHQLRNIVAFHHEAVDGSGYPYGLEGEDIPLEARIAAVADVFDALTSSRPYKPAWSNDEAMALLRREAGRKFDPQCVAALDADAAGILDIQEKFGDSPFD